LCTAIATWSGLSSDRAERSKVASSKRHCGEAVCQISFANAWRFAS
jgi:hypothetical protein